MESITVERFKEIKQMWDDATFEDRDEFLSNLLQVAWHSLREQNN